MNSKTELQAEFEAAKPGYGFAKLPDGRYLYEGIQDMFNDWLENNELRKAKLRITELEALCLNALYHHQGASSAVGQPIRKALGMGKYDRITEAQLKIIHNVRAPYAVIAEGKA